MTGWSFQSLLRAGVVLGASLAASSASPQQPDDPQCIDDAMLVFDGSGSMAEMGFNGLDQPRIVEARRAIREVIPQVTPFRKLGLIVYGPGRREECSNIRVKFPPINNAASRVIREIESLKPFGNTPLTASVLKAANTLQYKQKPGVVVLITDGKETCGGATCQLAAELASDAHGLTIHVIGFQVRGDFFAWRSQRKEEYENGRTVARCLADRTGGYFESTETTDELVAALQKTLGCSVIGRADTETETISRHTKIGSG